MFKHYQDEADKYYKSLGTGMRLYQGNEFLNFEQELSRELISSEISLTFMKKLILKYCEDLKN